MSATRTLTCAHSRMRSNHPAVPEQRVPRSYDAGDTLKML